MIDNISGTGMSQTWNYSDIDQIPFSSNLRSPSFWSEIGPARNACLNYAARVSQKKTRHEEYAGGFPTGMEAFAKLSDPRGGRAKCHYFGEVPFIALDRDGQRDMRISRISSPSPRNATTGCANG